MHVSLSSTAVLGYEERWCKQRIGFKQPTKLSKCQMGKWCEGKMVNQAFLAFS